MYNCTSVPEVCLVVCTGPVPTLPSLPPYVGLSDGSHSALRPRSLSPIPYFHYSRVSSHTLVIPLHEIQQSLHSKSVFCRNISNGRPNQKISKNKVVLFSNFASGRTIPTQSTGPQPIQLVPKHRFLHISLYRSLKSKNFKKQGGFIF